MMPMPKYSKTTASLVSQKHQNALEQVQTRDVDRKDTMCTFLRMENKGVKKGVQ